MNQQAYEKALHQQALVAAELVGHVQSLLRHGQIAAGAAPNLARIIADYDRVGQEIKAALEVAA